MKKILTAVAALAICFAAQATEYAYSVVVNQTNGDAVEYLFENNPVATFEDDDMVMNVDEQHVRYPMADIVNLTINKTDLSGVGTLRADMTVAMSRDLITISRLEPGADVTVYDITGRLALSAKADASGRASLQLSGQGAGVYIVKAGRNSFKFIR